MGDVDDGPVGQDAFQVFCQGRGGQPPGEAQQVGQLIIRQRFVHLGEHHAESNLGDLGGQPAVGGGQPSRDRIHLAGGELPAEQAGGHGHGRQPIVQVLFGSRGEDGGLLPKPRCGHHAGARQDGGQWMRLMAQSAPGREIEQLETAAGIGGRSARIPTRWYAE